MKPLPPVWLPEYVPPRGHLIKIATGMLVAGRTSRSIASIGIRLILTAGGRESVFRQRLNGKRRREARMGAIIPGGMNLHRVRALLPTKGREKDAELEELLACAAGRPWVTVPMVCVIWRETSGSGSGTGMMRNPIFPGSIRIRAVQIPVRSVLVVVAAMAPIFCRR